MERVDRRERLDDAVITTGRSTGSDQTTATDEGRDAANAEHPACRERSGAAPTHRFDERGDDQDDIGRVGQDNIGRVGRDDTGSVGRDDIASVGRDDIVDDDRGSAEPR